jgi:hypothetical protein
MTQALFREPEQMLRDPVNTTLVREAENAGAKSREDSPG